MNKIDINQFDWLFEQDIPPLAGQPDMPAGGPPGMQPGMPGDPMGTGEQQIEANPPDVPPSQMGVEGDEESPEEQPPAVPPDDELEPQEPDMPEEEQDESDFEIWKINYVKESIKGDPNALIKMIYKVRDLDLEPPQRKFVEDNLEINLLRQNSNIFQASNELRNRIKKEFDHVNPAVSVVNHMIYVFEKYPLLNEIFIKLTGLGPARMDCHRKFLAAMLGAVQVGSGAQTEDLVFEEQDYSIRISTRFVSRWGDVNLGRWYLREDDPERFLKEPELQRLEGGSPEEKDVLRRRVIIESIAERFLERAFIINCVTPDGTIHHLGWDLGNSLRSAFLDGKLVVRTKNNDDREAFIDEEGGIIPVPHMGIYYVQETGELDSLGKPQVEEILFIEHRDGTLYFTAPLEIIKQSSLSLEGMLYKDVLWQGRPEDFFRIQRCVPSVAEMLLRQC